MKDAYTRMQLQLSVHFNDASETTKQFHDQVQVLTKTWVH